MQLLDLHAQRLFALVRGPEQVRLVAASQGLSTYAYRSVTGGQHFCPVCGTAVIRTSTQFPPPVSVNARCIEGIELTGLDIQPFDGRAIP